MRDSSGKTIGWRVRWREGKRRPSRSFSAKDKPLAERLVAELRAKQSGKTRRKRAKKQPGGATLSEYFTKGYAAKIGYSRETKKEIGASTRESRLNAWNHWVKPHLGHMPIRNITPADIEGLLKAITHAGRDEDGKFAVDQDGNALKPHPSWKNGRAAAEKCRTLLADIFHYALRDQVVASNPSIGVVIEHAVVKRDGSSDTDQAGVFNEIDDEENIVAGSIRIWFSDHEVQILIKGADERDRTLIKLLATVGVRIGELAALRVGDFDAEERQLTVRSTLSTKPKHLQKGVGAVRKQTKTAAGRRKINLPVQLVDELRELSEGRAAEAPLFTAKRGGIIRPDNFRSRNWKRALQRSGINGKITPHDLRHFAASKLLGDGIDIALVSRMLGHSNVGITDKLYRHLMPEHVNDAVEYWERPENQLGTHF